MGKWNLHLPRPVYHPAMTLRVGRTGLHVAKPNYKRLRYQILWPGSVSAALPWSPHLLLCFGFKLRCNLRQWQLTPYLIDGIIQLWVEDIAIGIIRPEHIPRRSLFPTATAKNESKRLQTWSAPRSPTKLSLPLRTSLCSLQVDKTAPRPVFDETA